MIPNQNPVAYTSRTYDSIMTDINSDAVLNSKPSWWKRLWAGIGHVVSVWLNSIANLLLLRTSYTREAVRDLVALIDYALTMQTTSSGVCLFYVDTSLGTAIFDFTVSATDLVARSQGNLNVSSKKFEARSPVTFSLVQSDFAANLANKSIDGLTVDLVYTGHKVRFETTDTLPAPFQSNTDYYVIYISATEVQIASSLANAYAGNYITPTNTGTGTHTLTLYSKAVPMYQQTTVASFPIGASDGISKWQEFNLSDKLILSDTLVASINLVDWTQKTTFIDSTSTSKHYKIVPKANQQLSIRFGNGVYGAIPGAFNIFVSYAYGGGSAANVHTVNFIVNYGGSETKLKGVSNCTLFTGGADEQLLTDAKQLAPMALKSRDRFITSEDGRTLALAYGGIAQCVVNRNFYGILTAQVVGIANGGGDLSPSLKTALQAYLIDRTELESIDVRVVSATITSVAVTSACKVLPGYVYADGVDKYFKLAYQLLLTEAGLEIQNSYVNNGIAMATTLLNTILGTSFGTSDYVQIKKLLDALTPASFGQTFQQSSVFAFIEDNVIGIDYMTIASFGTGFPMTFGSSEISTVGTLTLTEI